jgi:uncharacterized protein YndB with AHSA1/START domain
MAQAAQAKPSALPSNGSMVSVVSPPDDVASVHIQKESVIDAPQQVVWEAVLAELGPESEMPDGKPFPFVLEAFPGGRWFRDLGNNAGHLWGHVQVIKPPQLIEICGPMFMSYAASNFLQYRLTPEGDDRTKLKLTHRAIGQIPKDHQEGMTEGWDFIFKKIEEMALKRLKDKKGGK